MKKVFLLMVLCISLSAKWEVLGSNELDENGSGIFPKIGWVLEVKKASASNNYDGYSVFYGVGSFGIKGTSINSK